MPIQITKTSNDVYRLGGENFSSLAELMAAVDRLVGDLVEMGADISLKVSYDGRPGSRVNPAEVRFLTEAERRRKDA